MGDGQTLTLTIEGKKYEVAVGDLTQALVRVLVNGREFWVEIAPPHPTGSSAARAAAVEEPRASPSLARRSAVIAVTAASGLASPSSIPTDADIVAPMPGSIVDIRVKPGQRVERGDILCYLEAMKMNNAIFAPTAGVIKDVAVSGGQVVAYRQVLITYAD